MANLLRADRVGRTFEARASRAEGLSLEPSNDPAPLRFAAMLLRAQGSAADAIAALHGRRPLAGDLAVDCAALFPPLVDLLRAVGRGAPASIATLVGLRASEDEGTAVSRLLVSWSSDRSAAEDYFSRAFLRPYLETLRVLGVTPRRERARGRCPFCGGAPAVGRRRSGESQGAVRTLICASCGFEWETPRVRCPACFEAAPAKLPSFASDRHPLARIEACETCRRYAKTLDTSRDERILPEVDDLASLALDLWAREQGFERIEPGLAGS